MAENTRLHVVITMLRLAWQADRTAAALAFVLAGLGAITQSFFGLWLKFIVDGIHTGSPNSLGVGAVGGVISIAASVAVAYGGQRAQSRLRDHTRYLMNGQILNLVSAAPTLELHESPQHLNELYAFQREGYQPASPAEDGRTLRRHRADHHDCGPHGSCFRSFSRCRCSPYRRCSSVSRRAASSATAAGARPSPLGLLSISWS